MKKRRLYNICFFLLLFLINILSCCFHFGYCCQFDNIVSNNVVKTFVNYNSKHKRDMNKSNTTTDYKPIRIHIYYGILDHGLAAEQTTKLFSILEKARNKMSQLLSVKQISGPLLLPRIKACDKLWGPHSRNQNKCASIHRGYVGEFCENKIDYFQIPESHLDGLQVYNFSDPRPLSSSLPIGSGVSNTDYILYVNAQNTHLCQTQDVIAYASYCILDQFDRPIAGFINFCPFHLKEKHSERKATLVAVHELFHALGFSQDMFKKFKDCLSSSLIPCTEWKRTVITDKHKIYRLSLPTVVEKMQQHFGCNDMDFGAPLMTMKDGKIGSHWDSIILRGSLMSSDFGSAEYISIDPISAAAFADSGWYKVNFSNVDNYFWGKDGGCEFAVTESCDANSYFCNTNDDRKGCDYLYLTRSSCTKIGNWKKCGVYNLNTTGYCHNPMDFTNHTMSACFMFSNEKFQIKSLCAPYQCLSGNNLKININNAWLFCSPGVELDIEYEGEIFNFACPEWDIMCSSKRPEKYFNSEMSYNGSITEIEIFFNLLNMDKILKIGTIEEFHIAALQNLQSQSKVNISPIKSSINRIEDYYMLKASLKLLNKEETKLLKEFIMSGRFNFLFKSKVEVSTSGMRVNEAAKESNETFDDYLLFIILALTVVVIMIVVAVVLGYCRYKKWKPPTN